MELFIASSIIMFIAIFAMSINVLFFGRPASNTACGSDPSKEPNPKGSKCATGSAGLCPFDDNTGALRVQMKTKLNRK